MLTVDLMVNIGYDKTMKNKDFLSTAEVAKLLGISRVAVFKKIKSGQIKARKEGRNFVISLKDLPGAFGAFVGPGQEKEIKDAVDRAVRQYGEVFKLLGRE